MTTFPSEYQLATLQDVFDKVPTDRIKACLHELATGMQQTNAMAELLAATTSALTGHEVISAVKWPETTTWIDDGKGTLDSGLSSNAGVRRRPQGRSLSMDWLGRI